MLRFPLQSGIASLNILIKLAMWIGVMEDFVRKPNFQPRNNTLIKNIFYFWFKIKFARLTNIEL